MGIPQEGPKLLLSLYFMHQFHASIMHQLGVGA